MHGPVTEDPRVGAQIPRTALVVAENGAEIFNRVKTGNGTFTAAQNTANTGSGRIDQGSVVTPSAITGDTSLGGAVFFVGLSFGR